MEQYLNLIIWKKTPRRLAKNTLTVSHAEGRWGDTKLYPMVKYPFIAIGLESRVVEP